MDKRLEEIKSEYNNIPVPAEALSRIQRGIVKAKAETANSEPETANVTPIDHFSKDKNATSNSGKITNFATFRRVAIGFAAALGICIIAVNSSSAAAKTLGDIPVIGNIFRVLAIREYREDIGNASVNIAVPEVTTDSGSTAATDEVNADIDEYTAELYDVFKSDAETDGVSFSDLTVTHRVLCDNDDYFSLDILGTETGASGYEFHKFYTIDKATDRVLTLADIYGDTDFISAINEEIIRQMNEQMANDPEVTYFIGTDEYGEDGFTSIDESQNFYINDDGNVVICFNEYEVAPGSAGAPEFTLPF